MELKNGKHSISAKFANAQDAKNAQTALYNAGISHVTLDKISRFNIESSPEETQEIEKTMEECDISGIEFAGLIKTPVYENNLFDKNGNVVGYDTNSKVIDYTYHLRYDEFIAPILLYLQEIDARLTNAGF